MSEHDRFAERLPCRVVSLLKPGTIEGHFKKQAQPVEAVPTPLDRWNACCRDEGGGLGLALGWHITIGGNTGTGKSLLALNMGARAALAGWSVCYVNLEMSRTQIGTRLYSILTGVPVRYLERGPDFDRVAAEEVLERVAEMVPEGVEFFTNDHRQIRHVDTVVGWMRYMHRQHACRFFVIDYMQLVSSNYEQMLKEITDISMSVSAFAKDTGVLTVGVSQLNRESSRDYQNPPTPQSLMGGSPLENDSDQVALLNHTKYEPRDAFDDRLITRRVADTELLLCKNRHGPEGKLPITWDYADLSVNERKDGE